MMSKLLLVEDDQSIVSSLSDYLGNEGFKIESASGQKEAIEKLDNDQYDIAWWIFNYQMEMAFLFVLQLKKEELCRLFS